MIKVCKKTFEDPKECLNFDEKDLTCVYQLKMLRAGFVLLENNKGMYQWIKRDKAIKQGYTYFELGLMPNGNGLIEPDWRFIHSNCLVKEIKK